MKKIYSAIIIAIVMALNIMFVEPKYTVSALVVSAPTRWDSYAAMQYARTYYKNANTESYREYTADCTNFVSQCWHAGGVYTIQTKKSGYCGIDDPSSWFFSKGWISYMDKYSYSWTSASAFYDHFKNYRTHSDRIKSFDTETEYEEMVAYANVSDAIQFSYSTADNPDHTAICVGTFYGDIGLEYAQHTDNKLDYYFVGDSKWNSYETITIFSTLYWYRDGIPTKKN